MLNRAQLPREMHAVRLVHVIESEVDVRVVAAVLQTGGERDTRVP